MTASTPPFVGRTAEGRALLLSVRAARSVVLVAPPAYGKSALLRELLPTLEEVTVAVAVPKVAPFSAFLTDLYDALYAVKIHPPGVPVTGKLDADRAAWRKAHAGGTEARARSLVEALRRYVQAGLQPPVIVVDDAGGVTQSMVPVLVGLAAHAPLILAVYPDTLRKADTRRLWQVCDRVDLPELAPAESRELVTALSSAYGITNPDGRAYGNAVLSLSGGVTGEIVRLVRYVLASEVVQRRGGSALAQNAAARQERGVAQARRSGQVSLTFPGVTGSHVPRMCSLSRSSTHLPYVRVVCTSLCPRCSATSCSWKPARIGHVPAECLSAWRPRYGIPVRVHSVRRRARAASGVRPMAGSAASFTPSARRSSIREPASSIRRVFPPFPFITVSAQASRSMLPHFSPVISEARRPAMAPNRSSIRISTVAAFKSVRRSPSG